MFKLWGWEASEIARLKSEFQALKTELAEVNEQNKRYEKKLSELITYSISHQNTKAQKEICIIVRREAEKVFSYPSEKTTGAHLPILPTSATHKPTISPTMVTSPQSSPQYHQTSRNHSHHNTPPSLPPCHRRSFSQRPIRTSLRIRNRNRAHSQSWWAAHLIKISSWSHTTISEANHMHKAELQAS